MIWYAAPIIVRVIQPTSIRCECVKLSAFNNPANTPAIPKRRAGTKNFTLISSGAGVSDSLASVSNRFAERSRKASA